MVVDDATEEVTTSVCPGRQVVWHPRCLEVAEQLRVEAVCEPHVYAGRLARRNQGQQRRPLVVKARLEPRPTGILLSEVSKEVDRSCDRARPLPALEPVGHQGRGFAVRCKQYIQRREDTESPAGSDPGGPRCGRRPGNASGWSLPRVELSLPRTRSGSCPTLLCRRFVRRPSTWKVIVASVKRGASGQHPDDHDRSKRSHGLDVRAAPGLAPLARRHRTTTEARSVFPVRLRPLPCEPVRVPRAVSRKVPTACKGRQEVNSSGAPHAQPRAMGATDS